MRLDVIYSSSLIGILLFALWAKRRYAIAFSANTSDNSVTVYEIPKVIKQLEQTAHDGNFVVFLFDPPNSIATVHLQYSIEDGVVGLDWVFVSPQNIADQKKIVEFVSTLGYQLKEYEMNNTRYLRTTGDDISDLGKSIIKDFYKMDLNTNLDIVTEGFEWQPEPVK